MKKKVLSLILAFTVIATSAPVSNLTVYADDFTDEEIAISDVDTEAENGFTDDEIADIEESSEEEPNSETDNGDDVEDLEEDFSDSENDAELTIEPEENKEKSEEIETDITDAEEIDSGESQQAKFSGEYTYGDYRYAISGDKAMITGYTGDASLIFLPYEVNGYVVESIGNSAFCGNEHLRGISMQSSVKEIADYAFYECTNLSIVRIKGEGLERIGREAFRGCENLEDITLPSSIKECGGLIFYECKNLKTAGPTSGNYNVKLGFTETIPDGLLESSYLEEITIPDTVKNLGVGAFSGCEKLKKIKLSSVTTVIPNSAFNNCRSLESITLPNTVKEIGGYAFYRCNNLKKITIPDTVKEIGYYTFRECPNLTIYGYTGSYAETYASEQNIPFVSIGIAVNVEEYDYSSKLDQWLLDQGTSNAMNYLVKDMNFTNSAAVATFDSDFGSRVTEA